MNRIDRVSAILIHLQSKPVVTAEEIALRFGISKRTVYRDIKALEEAGIPVGADPGRGFYLVDGFHLPPVMLTRDEAGALLTAEKLVEKLTDHSVVTHYQSAMYKIRSVLPDSDKLYISTLCQNVEVFHSSKSEFANDYLSEIQQALVGKYTLTISYLSAYKDELTCERVVEPVGVCFYSLGWHLIAFCRLRREYRDFRIDRIVDLTVNPETFTDKPHRSVREYFDQMRYSSDLEEAVVRFDKSVVAQVSTSKYYYGFVDEVDNGNDVEMTFVSNDLGYLSRWLLMYADAVGVVSPESLKSKFAKLVGAVLAKAEKNILSKTC